jgi:hypothetical protein
VGAVHEVEYDSDGKVVNFEGELLLFEHFRGDVVGRAGEQIWVGGEVPSPFLSVSLER